MTKPLEQSTLGELLEGIGAKTPTPGGGAVAAAVAALAAALGRMVLNYSIGRKALAEFDKEQRRVLAELERLEQAVLKLADEDAAAYSRLNALWKLDKEDPERRRQWNEAVIAAIDVPTRLMQLCLDIVNLQVQLAGGVNALLRSDWAIAAVLAHAAAVAAMWNVRVNLPMLEDRERRKRLEAEASTLVQRVETGRKIIEQACEREEA